MRHPVEPGFKWGFVAALILLSSCSLFDNDPETEEATPKRQQHFMLVTSPPLNCFPDPLSCKLVYQGILTEKEAVISTHASYWGLTFDASVLQVHLAYIGHLDVPLDTGTRYHVGARMIISDDFFGSALEIGDASGMVFYAKSEEFAGDPSNPPPPSGWTVTMEPGEFDEYDLGCGFRGTPQVLVVSHGSQSIRLVEGQAGRLGAYLVTVLAAEKVDHTHQECRNRVPAELSYVIARVGE